MRRRAARPTRGAPSAAAPPIRPAPRPPCQACTPVAPSSTLPSPSPKSLDPGVWIPVEDARLEKTHERPVSEICDRKFACTQPPKALDGHQACERRACSSTDAAEERSARDTVVRQLQHASGDGDVVRRPPQTRPLPLQSGERGGHRLDRRSRRLSDCTDPGRTRASYL